MGNKQINMNNVNIPNAPVGWNIAVGSDQNKFAFELARKMSYTLGDVCIAFKDTFGSGIFERYPALSVLNFAEYPCCNTPTNQIFLSTEGNFPQQHIYQFSHELCHYIIHNPVCSDFRWLEETFCELMSWYVLSWIYQRYACNKLRHFNQTYATIPNYFKNSLEPKCIQLNGTPISAFIVDNINLLKTDCYKREINRTIAQSMCPLFEKYKVLWNVIFSLPLLRNGMELEQALHTLCNNASLPNELAKLLVSLFLE